MRVVTAKSTGCNSFVFRPERQSLGDLPENTVVDGEIVALNGSGHPDFNLLQHYRTKAPHIHYFVFDLLIYQNRDLTGLPLINRRQIMRSVLKFSSPRVRLVDYFEASAEEMIRAARGQGLEGVIAKRKDSRYEGGKRNGSWVKYRLNSGQELVIGGYVPGTHSLDSIIVGYYRGQELIYVARVRNGFVPASRRDVVGMVKAGLSPDIIVAKIKATSCSFDTNPTTLKELKDAGVPDSVILAMVQAPKN